jgi:hypothetical protein
LQSQQLKEKNKNQNKQKLLNNNIQKQQQQQQQHNNKNGTESTKLETVGLLNMKAKIAGAAHNDNVL